MKIRVGKKSVLERYGFRMGGGINHVRYDHKRRPTQLHVVCPNCKGLAIAQDVMAESEASHVGDMSPSWDASPFSTKCTKCNYSSEHLSYFDLPAPFHEVFVYGEKLWAWNAKHLEMIYLSLSGKDVSQHPYGFYATYIHGKWKKMRSKFVCAIEKHMQAHNLSYMDSPRSTRN